MLLNGLLLSCLLTQPWLGTTGRFSGPGSLTPSWKSMVISPAGGVYLYLPRIIFGSLLLMNPPRHIDGTTSILITRQRCWASLPALYSPWLGIGTAERNWKQVRAVKSGQCVNTSIDKTKKQVLGHPWQMYHGLRLSLCYDPHCQLSLLRWKYQT